MKYFLAICVFVGLALSHVSARRSGDCPDTEEVVWAVGPGGGCSVFRNKCHFNKANLTRKPPLTESTKEECQKGCASVCPQIYAPVSGVYKGQVRNFGNDCEKIVHTCQTGETFLD